MNNIALAKNPSKRNQENSSCKEEPKIETPLATMAKFLPKMISEEDNEINDHTES